MSYGYVVQLIRDSKHLLPRQMNICVLSSDVEKGGISLGEPVSWKTKLPSSSLLGAYKYTSHARYANILPSLLGLRSRSVGSFKQ